MVAQVRRSNGDRRFRPGRGREISHDAYAPSNRLGTAQTPEKLTCILTIVYPKVNAPGSA